MTSKRFASFALCLGISLVFAGALAPAAEAQTLAGYNCLQNLSNGEFKTSSASQLADDCQDQEIWQLSQPAGSAYYCIKNESNGQYLESSATKLSGDCDGSSEYWNVTQVSYQGETVY